ncbi:MAG: hypothetical protein PF450_07260, partial [Bacteroidales bacterium]|nr:hypothetical protein [Bacteroidales bacterium]
MRIKPEVDLQDVLLHIEKPGRYVGGEFGNKKQLEQNIHLTVILCFPDLYEIGMSNNAVRILYDQINRIDGVFCDLVFCPAPDFEDALNKKNLPLYGLISGLAVRDFDILAFSVGYELAATNLLTIIQSSRIALLCTQRSKNDP